MSWVIDMRTSGGNVSCSSSTAARILSDISSVFRPDFFMDYIVPEYRNVPAKQIFDVARDAPESARLIVVIKGTTIEGDDVRKTVALRLGPKADDGRKRLADAGLTVVPLGENLQIGGVKFGSSARKAGFEQGFEIDAIQLPSGRASPYWFYVPALLLIGVVFWSQGRRMAPPVRLAETLT